MKISQPIQLESNYHDIAHDESLVDEIINKARSNWNENISPSEFEIFLNELLQPYNNRSEGFRKSVVSQILKIVCKR